MEYSHSTARGKCNWYSTAQKHFANLPLTAAICPPTARQDTSDWKILRNFFAPVYPPDFEVRQPRAVRRRRDNRNLPGKNWGEICGNFTEILIPPGHHWPPNSGMIQGASVPPAATDNALSVTSAPQQRSCCTVSSRSTAALHHFNCIIHF